MKTGLSAKSLLLPPLLCIIGGVLMPCSHGGEKKETDNVGFSAGDAIVRPMDIAKDVAKTANERKEYLDHIMDNTQK